MKYLFILPVLVACFMIGNISTASAHCGACGADAHKAEHAMGKTCTKCADAGKKCGCAKKAEGKICTKNKHDHAAKKPCAMCDKSERAWEMKQRQNIFFND